MVLDDSQTFYSKDESGAAAAKQREASRRGGSVRG